MKKLRFTEFAIMGMLRGQGAGLPCPDCAAHEISSVTFCNRRARYCSIDASMISWMSALEHETPQLKPVLQSGACRLICSGKLGEKSDAAGSAPQAGKDGGGGQDSIRPLSLDQWLTRSQPAGLLSSERPVFR